jgi:hypothetical protein
MMNPDFEKTRHGFFDAQCASVRMLWWAISKATSAWSCFGHHEISCRIFLEKALLFIEEIFLVQLDRKMRISAETASVQRLLGPADVAKWLGVSSGWVRDHATRKEPHLKSVKVGKLLRFRPEDIEEFLRTGSDGSHQGGAAMARAFREAAGV